jgi:pyridoxal phosphate phosphatase PHOSPHO2
MIEALRLMKSRGAELYILSDANTVYIETALKVNAETSRPFMI